MTDSQVWALLVACIFCGWVASSRIHARTKPGDWLGNALTSIGDAVMITDKNGQVTQMNNVAEKLSGWKLSEAAGKPVSDIVAFFNHDTRYAVENPVRSALQSASVTKLPGNIILRACTGSEVPVECVAAPIGARGRIKGAILIFRDISERYFVLQSLLESEERLRTVTNEARIGLVMINRDRRYVYANNFYMKMIGFSDMFVIGKRVEEVLPVIYEQIKPHLDRAFAGERTSYEVKGNQKKELGLNRTYCVTYEPQVRQGLVVNVVIVVLDITDIKTPAIP